MLFDSLCTPQTDTFCKRSGYKGSKNCLLLRSLNLSLPFLEDALLALVEVFDQVLHYLQLYVELVCHILPLLTFPDCHLDDE